MAKITVFIEPLFDKINQLARMGRPNCLQQAITLFGDEFDINLLVSRIADTYTSNSNNLIFLDFLPLMSLGTRTRLHKLEELYDDIPFVVIAKEGIVFERLKTLKNISLIICDNENKVTNLYFSGKWKKSLSKLVPKRISVDDSILAFHNQYIENYLIDIIPTSLRTPPKKTRQHKSQPFSDGTWANLWIDVKAILNNPEVSFFIAYQMAYLLTNAFSKDIQEHGFVVGNNTAYVLASFLQLIFDNKELIMIDRLGPYPKLSKTRLIDLGIAEGKRYCMVEDVISTGRELDLTHLIVYLNDSFIERVITLFDLEVASSRLINDANIMALCKPSAEIGYIKYPKYQSVKGDTK